MAKRKFQTSVSQIYIHHNQIREVNLSEYQYHYITVEALDAIQRQYNQMRQLAAQAEALGEEIKRLNDEIAEKDAEIKRLRKRAGERREGWHEWREEQRDNRRK